VLRHALLLAFGPALVHGQDHGARARDAPQEGEVLRRVAKGYADACRTFDPDFPSTLSRADWGTIDWARPPAGHRAAPSWMGKEGIPAIRRLDDMTFGERV